MHVTPVRLMLCALTVASALQAGAADAKEYACPKKATEIEGISLFDGPPSGMADLEPDNAEDTKGAVDSWTLFDNKRGFWMVCHYAEPAEEFSLKLDDPKKSCTMVMKGSIKAGLKCE
jgi:hypothetical protein